MADGELHCGDNLEILKRQIGDETVDLVYLDPPFTSGATISHLFAEQNGHHNTEPGRVVEGAWLWDEAASDCFRETVESGGRIADSLKALHALLGNCNMMAYLTMMAPRLVELRRAMKPTGSIYLHCDPTASHYLKLLMDSVFGIDCYQNEIVWRYRRWRTGKYALYRWSLRFQRNHDVILFYSRSSTRERTFNHLYVNRAGSASGGSAAIGAALDRGEMERRLSSPTEQQESEGIRHDDVWDVGLVPPAKQMFPTQKPQLLLDRIITASSDRGQIVLDPFCGSGTAAVAAQKLGRRWIAIDISHFATALTKHRLRAAFGDGASYSVAGEPTTIAEAEELAVHSPYQFGWWALGLLGARPIESERGSEKGFDGRLYIFDEADAATDKQVIIAVRAGQNSARDVRDLRGAVDREKASIGVLVTLREPTQPMRSEAAKAGFYRSVGWDADYPRLQIVTVADLLGGKQVDMPPSRQAGSAQNAGEGGAGESSGHSVISRAASRYVS